jgi:hypothetical protein
MLRLLRDFVVIGPLVGLAISGNLWTILSRELSLKGLGANHELPKLTDFHCETCAALLAAAINTGVISDNATTKPNRATHSREDPRCSGHLFKST